MMNLKRRKSVEDFYSEAAARPKENLCCPVAHQGEGLSYIPREVLDVSYGCGSPITDGRPFEGETVLDLGCGAGVDCFVASRKVGPKGRVIGVDMTEEMLKKARRASVEVSRNLGFSNCEFRQGFLENIPVESESADLVVSNCVVNLSSDKPKVFSEINRVLKKGGRFVIADIVSDREVPPHMRDDKELWGECISGALTQEEFLNLSNKSGFYGLEILKDFQYRTVEEINFCSLTVRGHKSSKGPRCVYAGQYATYIGPYSSVSDDDGHTYPRGVPVEVCTDTQAMLSRSPYKGHFILTDERREGPSRACCPSPEAKRSDSCC